MPKLPRGKGKYGIRNYLQTPVGPAEPTAGSPLRLSEIKYSIYHGLNFDRLLVAGWEFKPSIGIVARDIDKLALDIQNFAVPLHLAAEYMSESIRQNFLQGGRPRKWHELAPLTIKLRKGAAGPILIRSGALMREATNPEIWTFTGTSASIQSLPDDVWYGTLHQQGYGSIVNVARKMLGWAAADEDVAALARKLFLNPRPVHRQTKFAIPQREFILFQEEDIEAVQNIFIDWMEALAAQVGRNWNAL
jgi:phage gpG-like protein